MCETKAVLLTLSIISLVAASFFIYQAHTGNNVGYHSKTKRQGSCKNEYKNYCLNGGDCYYLVEKDFVACNCTSLYGTK